MHLVLRPLACLGCGTGACHESWAPPPGVMPTGWKAVWRWLDAADGGCSGRQAQCCGQAFECGWQCSGSAGAPRQSLWPDSCAHCSQERQLATAQCPACRWRTSNSICELSPPPVLLTELVAVDDVRLQKQHAAFLVFSCHHGVAVW